VLENDSDLDGDDVRVSAFQNVSALGAAVTVNANGQFNYDPRGSAQLQNIAPGEVLTDTFTYTISDGNGGSATATVRVFVSRNTGGAHVVEILPGRETTNINFGNRRLQTPAALQGAIDLIAGDLAQ
jgi:VCBS repeat-containing protein